MVKSYNIMVFFKPLWDILFSVPSLQIQLYFCCFNHSTSSGFSSVSGGACFKMFEVMVFLLWLDSCRRLYVELCSSVRCSISLCLQKKSEINSQKLIILYSSKFPYMWAKEAVKDEICDLFHSFPRLLVFHSSYFSLLPPIMTYFWQRHQIAS